MALSPGDKLGPYEILSAIGKGGMGEVYKANDPRLQRDVAIKVSAQRFNERFEREARAVAALNHPNICQIYDVGPNYLVMELIEGPTLGEVIKEGPLALDQALRIADQIAEALFAAHEKLITHRDLKPGNIKVKEDGVVKVLDFGLAKIGNTPMSTATMASEESPTLSMTLTQAGMILGTAAYMSPEQARGKTVDARADIWAFGVVLYEMLTAERLFKGEDLGETLASVVKEKPDFSAIPAKARRLLEACLQKDPRQRLQAIGDRHMLLAEPEQAVVQALPAAKPARWPYALAAVGFLAAAALGALHFTEKPSPLPHLRFQITPPEGVRFAGTPPRIALSPDGTQIAFNATKEGKTEMWVRRLDSGDARPLPGSEASETPFWSPDSKSVGLFVGGKLKRIDVASGTVQVLCDAPVTDSGGSWSPDGQTILFSGRNPDFTVHQIPAAGGTAIPVLKLLPQEAYQRWPRFLPDGKHFVYFSTGKSPQDTGIAVAALDGTDRKLLLSSASGAEYAAGYLFYRAEEALVARPFDTGKLEFKGEPVQVLPSVPAQANGRISAGVTSNGVLVASEVAVDGGTNILTWVDRAGKQLSTVGQPGLYSQVSLSPDGRQLAMRSGNPGDIWGIDLARDVPSRITFDPAADGFPIWTHDGRALLFSSLRKGSGIYTKPSSGLGDEQLRVASESSQALGVSSDGKWLLFTKGPNGAHDVYAFPLQEKGEPVAVLTSVFEENSARFSPDGRWIAYMSNESGQPQVYVRSFPGSERKLQVSTMGGNQPRWRRDGKELYYLSADGAMMAVAVKSLAPIELGDTATLFASGLPPALGRSDYDVTADGSRFLLNRPITAAAQVPLTVIQNWQALLK